MKVRPFVPTKHLSSEMCLTVWLSCWFGRWTFKVFKFATSIITKLEFMFNQFGLSKFCLNSRISVCAYLCFLQATSFWSEENWWCLFHCVVAWKNQFHVFYRNIYPFVDNTDLWTSDIRNIVHSIMNENVCFHTCRWESNWTIPKWKYILLIGNIYICLQTGDVYKTSTTEMWRWLSFFENHTYDYLV